MCEFKLMITRCTKSPRMLPTELLARWDESPLSTRCGFSRRPDASVDRQPPSVLPLARPKGRTRNGREKVRIAPGAWRRPRLGFACRNGQLCVGLGASLGLLFGLLMSRGSGPDG